ncbi:ABC transporter ATP-binding protein [Conchiformibius steedae]|uniref:ABC transporter ATP-binding protein n=2 Tax=Conchiformibius steedae TaxID=153493 RepID=A0A3P2A972_9NEIS|nr:ABC transporter ATP-binding protein [Conchiformibius steedae]RRD90820.1 ABC transporter ATP-binding protein [Conchiformibius steedae]
MISVENVSHRYPAAAAPALEQVSLHIAAGTVLGLLGPNGAGKTTLMSLMAGLQPVQSGLITFDGVPLERLHRRVRRQISLVPQDFAFYPQLSVRDNMAFFAALYGVRDRAFTDSLLEQTGLAPHRRKAAKHLSGGLKRRLNFAIGLINRPRLIFLDEITVGIDPESRQFVLDSVATLGRQGVTVVYTSHYLNEIETLCNRLAVLHRGQIAFDGALDDLPTQEGLWLRTEPPLSSRHLSQLGGTPAAGGYRLPAHHSPEQVLPFLYAASYRIAACRFGKPSLEDFYLDFLRRADSAQDSPPSC